MGILARRALTGAAAGVTAVARRAPRPAARWGPQTLGAAKLLEVEAIVCQPVFVLSGVLCEVER